MRTPVLNTNRLYLRPFTVEDAQDVFDCWESDPDVAKYMFWCSHNDIEQSKKWVRKEKNKIEDADWYRFALILRENDALIGTGLIYYEEEVNCWEIAYNLGKKYWGKGYATEAMKEILSFAHDELGIEEVVGRYAKENLASGKVLRKLGFKYEKDIPYECNRGKNLREGIQCRLFL